MSIKPVKLADIKELNTQVLDAILGKVRPQEVQKSIHKEIRRAKSRLNVEREVQLRLMIAHLEFFGEHKKRGERQCRAVLLKQPESVEAMFEMASIAATRRDLSGAMCWLESAIQISERKVDYIGQLEALDRMLWTAKCDDTSVIFGKMRKLLGMAPNIKATQTMGAQCLLMDGRGPEAIYYLEDLLRHMLKRGSTYGYLRFAVMSLLAAFSQHGLTAEETRSKLEHFRQLCTNDDRRNHFDRAVKHAFDPSMYPPSPEIFGVKREWFEEEQA